jgi:hypothetical protein
MMYGRVGSGPPIGSGQAAPRYEQVLHRDGYHGHDGVSCFVRVCVPLLMSLPVPRLAEPPPPLRLTVEEWQAANEAMALFRSND